ncbi:hypothetical protein, partial [Thermococcus sp. GR7]|uniref:hypothetical protein n=1 Tax=Thermococcus sp. GR7 TaxID=1638257 RepID=UPI00142F57D0
THIIVEILGNAGEDYGILVKADSSVNDLLRSLVGILNDSDVKGLLNPLKKSWGFRTCLTVESMNVL